MTLLDVQSLDAFYGDFQALFGVDFSLGEGETVAIIGSNGAGKSTFLRALTGLVASNAQKLAYRSASIANMAPSDIVRLGIAMVPEGRRLFPSLSVEENLQMGSYLGRSGTWTLDRIYELFPVLRNCQNVAGTALSGGEQQMTAMAGR